MICDTCLLDRFTVIVVTVKHVKQWPLFNYRSMAYRRCAQPMRSVQHVGGIGLYLAHRPRNHNSYVYTFAKLCIIT